MNWWESPMIPSPCYVLDEQKFRANLSLIRNVSEQAGVEIILAFKGFSMWSVFPIVKEYVQGATASSLNEVRLCVEEMGVKSHTYFVAYSDHEFDEVVANSKHLSFNSLNQFERFRDRIPKNVSVGLRVNPEWSDVQTDLYNPASPTSRLGVTASQMPDSLPDGIEGLHFHVLCESNSHALEKVLVAFEEKFGGHLERIKWINMGGGHLMTREDYDTDHLISILKAFKEKNDVQIILEPGSAFAWQAGDLVTTVLDIVENGGIKTALLDVSFTCHMPDTLEMPYRPDIADGSSDKNEFGYRYRLGGVSCLAGDFLDEYSFEQPIQIGDRLVLKDMIHYTMVKTSMFNGIQHPSIGILRENDHFELLRAFDFEDYKTRLS